MVTRYASEQWRDEDGAVTVDWVVLTGGLIIFGVVVASSIIAGATGTGGSVGSQLGAATVPDVDFDGP